MAEKKANLWHEFTKGLIKENPVLRLVLGCCATLALSTAASNAIGMGVATTFVLVCSNAVISALRKVIPDKVRIPCYIVIIAGFVSVVQMLIEAFSPRFESHTRNLPAPDRCKLHYFGPCRRFCKQK